MMWEQAEARREAFVARVLALAPEARVRRQNGALSPAECIAHLAKVESMYLPMIRPLEGEARPNGLYRWLVARSRTGKAMPTVGSLTPEVPDIEGAISAWESGRAALREKLAAIPEGQAALRHPLFGRLSTEDLLVLFDAHLTYHEIRAFAN